jgi:hypothetical protein
MTTTIATTRRAILARLGVAAALAGGAGVNTHAIATTRADALPAPAARPPVSPSPDPVYAAIEAHKAALIEREAAMAAFNAIEGRALKAINAGRRAPKGWPAARDRYDAAGWAVTEAHTALALTIATTPEGAKAQVAYWAEHAGEWEEWDDLEIRGALRLMTSLVYTIGAMAGGAA